ncbi:hypothetical protein PIGHUM_02792 [Pigmentiphaga humi]|uniref:Uncharacterized protein n=1 Tax=Pigmentiphaga humi TaxID=2478468 RepID=A0A3P4B5A9_9BURK|nr:hypothetical protein [Pigmentiphaga humi]VCU70716.1 hypothetical protein PIGHUM_02792 [Pigmentiphaga humi]
MDFPQYARQFSRPKGGMADLVELYLTGRRVGDVRVLKRSDISEQGISFRQPKTGAKLLVQSAPDFKAALERARALNDNLVGMYLLRTRLDPAAAPSCGTVRDT